MMKRSFDDIIANLKETIASYDYFVDFEKVYRNVDDVLIPLNLMNSLLGREDFDDAFIRLIHKYPESLRAIPILIAVRDPKILVLDGEVIQFRFDDRTNSDAEYLKFMKETGLKKLFTSGRISSLVDYVTGVEVGLDSNARKNRTGTLMEDRVENYLKQFVPDIKYLRQADKEEIIRQFGYPELNSLNLREGRSQADKRFDFAVKYKDLVLLIETNFYGSGGSKLNEVSRSYEKLADDINSLPHYRFLWITDGKGWISARSNLKESYSHQEMMMAIKDMENENLMQLIDDYIESINVK